jgi:hypothetical protein
MKNTLVGRYQTEAEKRKCAVNGCRVKHYAKGFCEKHYGAFKRHGDPLIGRTPPAETRAWIDAHAGYKASECLIWPFARNLNGYAQSTVDGKKMYVHRRMLAMICEPPSPKHEAAHSCGNGKIGCANPRHLSWKTRTENEAGKLIHGTRQFGEATKVAKLTAEKVIEIRDRVSNGEKHSIVAKDYGIAKNTVSRIAARTSWTWL